MSISRNVYLKGYWQSEKYFGSIAPFLREDLRIKGAISADYQVWAERIARHQSVSLHVRRGDYVNNPLINAASRDLCSFGLL